MSVPCLLPDFGVVEVEVDDDEGERRDALASFGFKQSPEVTVLEDEWREFLIGRRGCEFAHKFDALFVQLSAQWKDRPLLQLGNIIQLTLPFIREHLLEGQLVKERILDGAAVELALQGSPGQTQRHRQ